jgi:hypothetical protein
MTLASAIATAERRLRAVEGMVEELLTTMFPATETSRGWRGWRFVHGVNNRYGVEVFEVDVNKTAVRALFGAGFTSVCLHPHPAAKLLSCSCRTWDAY